MGNPSTVKGLKFNMRVLINCKNANEILTKTLKYLHESNMLNTYKFFGTDFTLKVNVEKQGCFNCSILKLKDEIFFKHVLIQLKNKKVTERHYKMDHFICSANAQAQIPFFFIIRAKRTLKKCIAPDKCIHL